MKKKSLILLAATLSLIASIGALTGCKSLTSGLNVYSTADDLKFGADVVKQINADPKNYPILKNEPLKTYVQSIVDKIIKAPEVKYRGVFVYKVEIIDKADVINAFCCPGGYIYVYTGLLRFVPDEATLAAVLAHEVAHAELRHATQRMTSQKGVESLVNLYKDKNKNKTTDAIAGAVSGLTLLANSRENEYEADESSFKYLLSTEWYPGAILRFFEKIKATVGGGGNAFEGLLSTHPLPEDRVDKAVDRLKTHDINPPTEANLFAESYAEKIKKLIK